MSDRKAFRFAGLIIMLAMIGLMAIGVLAIRAAELADGETGFMKKQMIFAAVGFFAFLVFASIPFGKIGRLAYPLFGVTLTLLIAVFFTQEVRGSHRWFDLKVLKFQPSELAKISYIILLAWYLRLGNNYRRLLGLIPPFILTFIPLVLVLRQPDLGTSLLFLPTLYVMLYMAGAKLKHLLGIVAIGTILVFMPIPQRAAEMSAGVRADRTATAYWTMGQGDDEIIVSAAALAVMKKHQLERIDGFLRQDDPKVIQGKGYHLHHSKIVLGSGKMAGRGDWDEADVYFRLLPDDHTDFVYSVIGGQWGFVGCSLVLVLYGVIFVMGVEIAGTTYDAFGRLLAVGVLGLLISQIFINVGMTMGIMPITGMTLPLISYGGSSLVVNCIALGLLVNVGQCRTLSFSRRPFEHKEDTSPISGGPLGQADQMRGLR